MAPPPRLLVVEAAGRRARAIMVALRRGGVDPVCRLISQTGELRGALDEGPWDAVICGHATDGPDASAALAAVRDHDGECPFIVVSDCLSEDSVASLVRSGASGYVASGASPLLAPLVERGVREAAERTAWRECEARYRALVEYSPEAVTVHDGERFLYANDAAVRMFGFADAGGLVGAPVADRIHPDDRAEYLDRNARIRDTGQPGPVNEHRRIRLDGSEIRVRTRGIPTRWNGSCAYMGILIDVTAERRAEAEARHREAELLRVQRLGAMGGLATAIAHELNQPLAAMMGYVQAGRRRLQKENPGGSGDIVDLLDRAAGQAERAGTIIRRMRLFLERREIVREPADINRLILEAMSVPQAGTPNAGIVFALAPDLPLVGIDRIQVQQVLLNLVRNGIEAMKDCADRTLHVRTYADGSGVVVAVRDHGPGQSREDSRDLFETFIPTGPEGMGAGLAICRTIVEAHGGKIWAEAAPGGGTEFHFLLMAARPAEELRLG